MINLEKRVAIHMEVVEECKDYENPLPYEDVRSYLITSGSIISELQTELAARDCLLRDIVKDYQGLAQAADTNNLYRTAKDARETIAHIMTILQHTTTKEDY